jgi:hypothetical protein
VLVGPGVEDVCGRNIAKALDFFLLITSPMTCTSREAGGSRELMWIS